MGEMFAGRYELIDQIGEGGMGSVWRVHDHKSRRLVAAKLLRQSDAGSLLRFMREQGMRIEHNHVVTPLGWAGEDGRVIFTMPLIDGGSLSELVKENGALPYPLVAELMRQILDGVDACHSAGIVHRDIKPANILLEATGMGVPSAWITDFGIAVSVDAPRLTSNEMVLGTPGYMSPEQAKGDDPDPRQDLYSAGMMGLHMLTGIKPGASIRARKDDVPPRPEGIPDSLWNLLVALADPVADRRPANARDALSWLMLPENAWQEWAARPIPDRLPEMTTSGEFVRLEAGAAARALDGFTDSSAAPATVIDGAAVRRRPTVKAWIAAPAALAAAIAAAFALWQPWGAGDGAYDPQLANTGGVCAYADAGTTAQTTSGKTLTCTEKDGSYSWQG